MSLSALVVCSMSFSSVFRRSSSITSWSSSCPRRKFMYESSNSKFPVSFGRLRACRFNDACVDVMPALRSCSFSQSLASLAS
ncbi:hypothetical protein DL89DRAFT_6634 [Linderina pennispora]|uniref:Uncharacterized protein n=1 Tax=Linderina pennispora TaxID=61395 RepID=A0A1Y1WKB1_9FUNG|nr:uncharacterized protein DL89DRAFT_6634 [Linderina pennispora]ORX73923.1 hypothetical protein DL89DRAFT_6634 [Linderina pennispora]